MRRVSRAGLLSCTAIIVVVTITAACGAARRAGQDLGSVALRPSDAPPDTSRADASGYQNLTKFVTTDLLGGTLDDVEEAHALQSFGFMRGYAAFFPSRDWSQPPPARARLIESFVMEFPSCVRAHDAYTWLVGGGLAPDLRAMASFPATSFGDDATGIDMGMLLTAPITLDRGGSLLMWRRGSLVLAVLAIAKPGVERRDELTALASTMDSRAR